MRNKASPLNHQEASFSYSCSPYHLWTNQDSSTRTSSFTEAFFPEPPKGTRAQSSTSPTGRQAFDPGCGEGLYCIRDQGGRGKTATKEEAAGRAVKRRDSPRPLQAVPNQWKAPTELGQWEAKCPSDLKELLEFLLNFEKHLGIDAARVIQDHHISKDVHGNNFKGMPRFS
ncbi:unnamed protein product [Prunus armeniaca]|uniref:Uncharacterized protein n=1 Tax=Prunus armeniaca TaxID=36596 RepID=A0A6J5V163_PRUAR|nr:unnamed protein product [Prunus armeniaca]